MIINLVAGDWSHDGHGLTTTTVIESNKTAKELETAYKEGCKIIGFKFQDEVASEYEESWISLDHYNMLVKHGLTLELEEDEDMNIEIDPDDYVSMWMFVAKLGDPSLVYTEIDGNEIHIDGYGLFSQ